MKKIIFILTLLGVHSFLIAQTQKVAVVVTGDGIGESYKRLLGDNLVSAFQESGNYVAVERSSSFNQALDEVLTYQQNGKVDMKQVASTVRQSGEQLACIVDVYMVDNHYYFSAHLLDVVKNEIVMTASSLLPQSSLCVSSIIVTASELQKKLTPNYKNEIDVSSTQRAEDMEKYLGRNITFAEFKYRYTSKDVDKQTYKLMEDASTRYYLEKSFHARRVRYGCNIAGFCLIGPTILGCVMGTELSGTKYDTEKPKQLRKIIYPVMAGALVAYFIPGLICETTASGYDRKAWKAYRKPYDDAKMGYKYSQVELKFAPMVGIDYAGALMRITLQ